MNEVERKLAAAGVYAGLNGLEGLANSSEFWNEQPYGTRLYYGPGGGMYLHRDVLQAAIAILKEPTNDTEELEKLRAKFHNLQERLKDVLAACNEVTVSERVVAND